MKLLHRLAAIFLFSSFVSSSEYPDRECCDSAPPPPPNYHTVTPFSTSQQTTPKGLVRGYGQREPTTYNCLEAKRICDENINCSAVLRVIPSLCGPELVACSTVTVSRCQAALRTLSSFDWFQPTCLCKEPKLDPKCNAFRDLLFDHPCVFVRRKEVDMHPMQFIPTCTDAAETCKANPWCHQRLEDSKNSCKFKDNSCKEGYRDECIKAWMQMRETPLLGCICPGNSDRKCLKLHDLVNKNPCVANGTEYGYWIQEMERVSKALMSPLMKPLLEHSILSFSEESSLNSMDGMGVSPSDTDYYFHLIAPSLNLTLSENMHSDVVESTPSSLNQYRFNGIVGDLEKMSKKIIPVSTSNDKIDATSSREIFRLNNFNVIGEDYVAGVGNIGTIHKLESFGDGPRENFNDERHQEWGEKDDLNIEGEEKDFWDNNDYDFSYDSYTLPKPTLRHQHNKLKSKKNWDEHEADKSDHNIFAMIPKRDPELSLQQVKLVTATCREALDDCMAEEKCNRQLEEISGRCETAYCHQGSCQTAVQSLYRLLMEKHQELALKIGLCVCRPSGGRNETECVRAQRKLHPHCAEKTDSISLSQCHRIGRSCRSDRVCRYRLEYYEQACAADTMTGRCAGQHQDCRKATLGLLGTDLHTNCVCKGDSFISLGRCLAWKRLLWTNPCVVESQLTYHLDKLGTGVELLSTKLESLSPTDHDDLAPPGDLYLPSSFETVVEEDYNSNYISPDVIDTNYPEGSLENSAEEDPPSLYANVNMHEYEDHVDHNGLSQGIAKNPGLYGQVFERPAYPDYEDHNSGHLGGSFRGDPIRRINYFTQSANGSHVNNFLKYPSHTDDAFKKVFSKFGTKSTRVQARKVVDADPPLQVGGSVFRTKLNSLDARTDVEINPVKELEEGDWSQGRSNVFAETTSYESILPSQIETTTSREPTTTLPEKYCVIEKPWENEKRILEVGSSVRLYRNGDKDCTELCSCNEDQRTLCAVLDCVKNIPCEAKFAVYNHKAPAYQAYRGHCICYSGDFICMRPQPDEYHLPPGLFLLLGFSQTEETLLENVTNEKAVDTLAELKEMLRGLSTKIGDECILTLYQNTSDNLILQVRHLKMFNSHPNTSYTLLMLQKERNVCRSAVEKLANKINDHDAYIHHHVSLSLFILAEVMDNIPRAIRSAAPSLHHNRNGAIHLFASIIRNLFSGKVRRGQCHRKEFGRSIDCLLGGKKSWETREIDLPGAEFDSDIQSTDTFKCFDIGTKIYSFLTNFFGFSFELCDKRTFFFSPERRKSISCLDSEAHFTSTDSHIESHQSTLKQSLLNLKQNNSTKRRRNNHNAPFAAMNILGKTWKCLDKIVLDLITMTLVVSFFYLRLL